MRRRVGTAFKLDDLFPYDEVGRDALSCFGRSGAITLNCVCVVLFPLGPISEESREQVRLAAENCGGSHQTIQRR